MGLFSRFFVPVLPCTAEGTLCRARDEWNVRLPFPHYAMSAHSRINSKNQCFSVAEGISPKIVR